jgi:hypothetical protein
MVVMEKDFGEAEGVSILSLFDEIEGRDDGNPPFSEGGRGGELVELGAVGIEVVTTEDFWGGKVDEVSVIDIRGIAEIEVYNPLMKGGRLALLD